ncbi:MAG: PfkB family carbohydrate kinase [Puniceicoccales bacterium]|jgi:sugar/nucleoside kinase (ribokinase family)|nr:PfkB family carbohydrate kinase [Puniceicoccales bacterium]
MEDRVRLLATLEWAESVPIFAGFDGAVDGIYALIASRTAAGPERMGTIGEFARRIASAANRSTNIERVLLEMRAGGNATLCASALQTLGHTVTLVANVGRPIHPAFNGLVEGGACVHSLGEPNRTDALEFFDGKIMLTDSGQLTTCTAAGHFPTDLGSLFAGRRAIVLTNWTMMPRGTEIFSQIFRQYLPAVSRSVPIFFDIADPARRANDEIVALLDLLARFAETHPIYLSVNLKELERIGGLLGGRSNERADLAEMMEKLHKRWPIEWILHRLDGAESFGESGWHSAEGFFTAEPHTTTGGGDHFNGGFLFGLLAGLPRPLALCMGNAISGAYVRSGKSPNRSELREFLLAN